MRIEEILINHITNTSTGIPLDKIEGIYLYGSRVYRSATEDSDWDFVVINSAGVDYEYMSAEIDIHYISTETFQRKLEDHDIMCLETYYQNIQGDPIMYYDIDFTLDLAKLRKSVSSTCNNSFVKFKKKLTLENEDNYIGIKSLFHSLRIAEMGRKLAINKNNALIAEPYVWEKIKVDATFFKFNWESLHEKYKPLYNEVMSDFRKVAPKTPNEKKKDKDV